MSGVINVKSSDWQFSHCIFPNASYCVCFCILKSNSSAPHSFKPSENNNDWPLKLGSKALNLVQRTIPTALPNVVLDLKKWQMSTVQIQLLSKAPWNDKCLGSVDLSSTLSPLPWQPDCHLQMDRTGSRGLLSLCIWWVIIQMHTKIFFI